MISLPSPSTRQNSRRRTRPFPFPRGDSGTRHFLFFARSTRVCNPHSLLFFLGSHVIPICAQGTFLILIPTRSTFRRTRASFQLPFDSPSPLIPPILPSPLSRTALPVLNDPSSHDPFYLSTKGEDWPILVPPLWSAASLLPFFSHDSFFSPL